jgi:hypothetical protein
MKTYQSAAFFLQQSTCLTMFSVYTVSAQKVESVGSAYYSAQRPYAPPLPFNPFPELPIVEVAAKRFLYDDTEVDYGGLLMMSSSAPPAPGGGGGTNIPPYLPPTVAIPGTPLLTIDVLDGGVKRISFSSEPGLVYRIDESIDLSSGVWNEIDRIVATATTTEFLASDGGMRSTES